MYFRVIFLSNFIRQKGIQAQRMKYVGIWSFLLLTATAVMGQPSNDECATAIILPKTERYCSQNEEFTIEDATPSGFGAPSCWLNGQRSHDVWFKFTALKTAVRVTVKGRNMISNFSGTLNEPELALYSGNCSGTINQIQCGTDLKGDNVLEIVRSQLVVGEEYIIRVDARALNQGTFQLCVDQSNPPVEAGSDCFSGSILCDKETILVEKTSGEGMDASEMDDGCFDGPGGEHDSKWFRWTCKTSGSLLFTLFPNNEPDDLDFVLWELPNGLNDCSDRVLIRCMASWSMLNSNCYGPTGLRDGETDISERPNCPPGQNNFIAPVDMVAGTAYALGVSNFSQSESGFTLEWGGTGEFQGPDADFIVNPNTGLKCDEVFVVTDLSGFENGVVSGWEWNFGKDAEPQSDTTQGPHNVVYTSFGLKQISLTITTDLGCKVTIIKSIFVEPCCEDLPDLEAIRDSIVHLNCGGDSTGAIFVSANGGSPDYEYSLDGVNFSKEGSFYNLKAGSYNVIARDIKGCLDTIVLTVIEPPILSVSAGPDRTINLGECIFIDAFVTPSGSVVSYKWEGGGEYDIDCDSCQRTKVLPSMGTSTYIITVRDSMGCEAIDSVTIFVEIVRPYFAPNVITGNGDNINDVFTIFGGAGLAAIITLEVYDRWGELVYKGENFPPGEEGIQMGFGWNGRFHNKKMNPAVFVYKAELKYIDNVVITITGSFTILR